MSQFDCLRRRRAVLMRACVDRYAGVSQLSYGCLRGLSVAVPLLIRRIMRWTRRSAHWSVDRV